MSYNSITVGTTPTLIVASNDKRRSVVIVNNSDSTVVYIGPDSNITALNCVPLYEGQTTHRDTFPESYRGDVYGIVSSGSADVRYWETEL